MLFAVIGGPGVATPTPYRYRSGENLYQTMKRPMVFEVEISRTIFATSGRSTFYEYFVALQPVVSVGGNVQYRYGLCVEQRCRSRRSVLVEERYTSFGVGATPFGAKMTTSLPFSAKLSLSAAGGAVLLNKAIPYDKAKRANFQITVRPALGVPLAHVGTLWAGYEFFHMSNANTSPINPGINAGLIMFGFQRGN